MSLATAALNGSVLTAALEQIARHLAASAARAQLDQKRKQASLAGEALGKLLPALHLRALASLNLSAILKPAFRVHQGAILSGAVRAFHTVLCAIWPHSTAVPSAVPCRLVCQLRRSVYWLLTSGLCLYSEVVHVIWQSPGRLEA